MTPPQFLLRKWGDTPPFMDFFYAKWWDQRVSEFIASSLRRVKDEDRL